MVEHEGIFIRSPTPADLPALRTLVLDIFARKEPMTSFLGIGAEGFSYTYDQLAGEMDLQTSSIACLPSGDIVACILTADLKAPINTSGFPPGSMPDIKLVEVLDAWFRKEMDLDGKNVDKRVLHITMGATSDAYEGKGISKRLRGETLRKAKECGWDMAVVECTNVKTQHLMQNVFNFKPGKEIKFSEFEVNGKRPMEGLDGSAVLMYRALTE